MKYFWQTIKDKLTKIDYFFLSFIVLITLFFAFAIPPMQMPDEIVHYQKSVDLAFGNFFSNDKLDRKLISDFFINWPKYIEAEKITNQYNEKFYFSDIRKAEDYFTNKKIYFPGIDLPTTGYLMSSLGIKIGSLFNTANGVTMGFYLARLLNVIFFFFTILIALYLIPKNYKNLLFSFLLFPMLLHQGAAINYDSFLNSIVILVFSYLIYLTKKYQSEKIEKKDFFIFLGLLTILTIVKSGYYLFFLLIFIFPFWQAFKKKCSYFLFLFLSLIFVTGFFLQTTKGLINDIPGGIINLGNGRNEYVSSTDQKTLIGKNPLMLKAVIIDTTFKKDIEYFKSLIGVFGSLDVPLPFFVDFIFILVILLLIAQQIKLTKNDSLLSWKQMWLIFLISFCTMGAIFLSFYLFWTPVGASLIEGVQGRYFLPLLPFVFLFFIELVKKMGLKKFVNYFMIGSLLTTALFSVYVVYKHYWDYQELVTISVDSRASGSATLKEK